MAGSRHRAFSSSREAADAGSLSRRDQDQKRIFAVEWNATRDYLDVAALSHRLGLRKSAAALEGMNGPRIPGHRRTLDDWRTIVEQCRSLALALRRPPIATPAPSSGPRAPGRPPSLDPQQWHELEADQQKEPAGFGLILTGWDGASLSEHVLRRFAIRLGARQCQRIFRQLGSRARKSIKRLETALAPSGFGGIERSLLLNFRAIVSSEPIRANRHA